MGTRRATLADFEYALARTERLIAARFTSAAMSDAKWVRLLDALTAQRGLVASCAVKLVWDCEVRTIQIDGMSYNFNYWPHAMEAMISGAPRGWHGYNEIEWAEFPAHGQDLGRIRPVIDAAGQFDLHASPSGLRLVAYR
jgi:hypothetical protein